MGWRFYLLVLANFPRVKRHAQKGNELLLLLYLITEWEGQVRTTYKNTCFQRACCFMVSK
ncbi:hypothetical protein J26TS2_41000 [Shouchella clausii]|nr:hypothetical protein J26TS2_41000 [Shouchella clausii]